jgi:hypothetical protein
MVSAAVVLPRATLPPSAEAPSVLPKTRKVERRVFLEAELWKRLSDAAEFHTEAFKAIEGVDETVSRNDLIESFLKWALGQFWEAKHGEPTSETDRKKKVAAFAVELKAKLDAKKSDDSQR